MSKQEQTLVGLAQYYLAQHKAGTLNPELRRSVEIALDHARLELSPREFAGHPAWLKDYLEMWEKYQPGEIAVLQEFVRTAPAMFAPIA